MIPKNKMYLTSQDFAQWSDYFGELISSDKRYDKKECGDCSICSSFCSSNESNIRTKNITFVVTEKCNLNCTYCYQTNKTGRRMTKEVAKQSVDFLFDKQKINGYYDFDDSVAVILEFIGGEPLLEIDLIDYIVEYFKFKAFEVGSPWATNYMISTSSNGVLCETKKVQNFIKRNLGRVSIGITIDGNKELHDKCRVFYDGNGSYDIVESSVKAWLKINSNAQTKITLAPENVMFLNDAIKNVWNLGLKGVFTNCVFEEGWKTGDATILYHQMIELADYLLEDNNYENYFCSLFDESIGKKNNEDKNWCGGNGEMLAIAPDGKCFPCIRFMGYSLNGREEQPIGDIYKGLDKKEDNAWLNELSQITMSSQCTQEDNIKCLTCPIASGCALCTGYNYDKFGTPNHKATFICEMHQARVMANVHFFNTLYKKLGLLDKFELNISKEWALKIITEKEYNNLIFLGGE
jgi:uncharacterized protein